MRSARSPRSTPCDALGGPIPKAAFLDLDAAAAASTVAAPRFFGSARVPGRRRVRAPGRRRSASFPVAMPSAAIPSPFPTPPTTNLPSHPNPVHSGRRTNTTRKRDDRGACRRRRRYHQVSSSCSSPMQQPRQQPRGIYFWLITRRLRPPPLLLLPPVRLSTSQCTSAAL